MTNDQIWRQVPCDLVNNPRIRSIAKRIEPMYRQAVFAFYISIYMEADVDGFIDLSDIEVYADQLMIDDEEVINLLIEKFTEKDFITPVKNGLYYITDFTNPNNYTISNGHKTYESAEARRERINRTIAGNKKKKSAPQKTENVSETTESYPQEAETKLENPEKNTPTVTLFEKASRKLNKEIHTDIQTNTHTLKETEKINAPAQNENKNTENPDIAEPEENAEPQERQEESTEVTELAEKAIVTEEAQNAESEAQEEPEVLETEQSQKTWTMQDSQRAKTELNIPDSVAARLIALRSQNDWKTAGVLYSFFNKHNAFAIKDDIQLDILQQIIIDINQCEEPKNPGYVIAGQLCTQFENLVTQKGAFTHGYDYFKNMPICPKMMRSQSVWPRITAEMMKTLSPGKTGEEHMTNVLDRWAEEMRKDKEIYGNSNFFDDEMRKKGIDPSKKGATLDFIRRIAMEQRAKKVEEVSTS